MQSGREDTLEERYAIKFCFKLGKNARETYGMFQTAFRPSCMNRALGFEWHKRFKEGRESVRKDERCEKSKDVRTSDLIGQINNFLDKDRHVSIKTISTQFEVSVGTVHTIIRKELKMRRICAKFVPRCSENIRKKDVVMTARKWSSWSIQIPQFLMLWWPAMKAGSTAMTQRPRDRVPSGSILVLPNPRRPDRTNPPTNFWVPTGQTVNKEYFVEVLREFRKIFRQKGPSLFKSGQWQLKCGYKFLIQRIKH